MARNQHRQQRGRLWIRSTSAESPAPRAPDGRVSVDPPPAVSGTFAAPTPLHAIRIEIRNEIRNELRHELRNEIRSELRDEIRAELRTELQSDMRAQMAAERERVSLRLNQVAAQSSSIVEQVNDATAWLHRRLEDTGRALEAQIDERSTLLSSRLDAVASETTSLVAEQTGLVERVAKLADDVGRVDASALDEMREQMSAAIGESMLVRIEMERMGASTAEAIDTLNVRIGELATQIADTTMDASAAVQLERLEEIERALIELDPDRFLRNPDYVECWSLDGSRTVISDDDDRDNDDSDDDDRDDDGRIEASTDFDHLGRHAAAEVQAYDRVAEVMQSPDRSAFVSPSPEPIPDPVWADVRSETESNLTSW